MFEISSTKDGVHKKNSLFVKFPNTALYSLHNYQEKFTKTSPFVVGFCSICSGFIQGGDQLTMDYFDNLESSLL
jgi:hypothetical protein